MTSTFDENEDMEEVPVLPHLSLKLSKSLPLMTEFYSSFSCPICYEPMRNPVMAQKCGHDFCSLCVRKYLLYKQQCPSCFQPLHDSELRPNRSLEGTIGLFSRLVPQIDAMVKELKPDFKLPPPQSPSVSAKTKVVSTVPPQNSQSPRPSTSTDKRPEREFSIPSSQQSPAVSTKTSSENSASQGSKVPCPVCSVSVLEKNVNAHLDKCLAEQKGELPLKPMTNVNRMHPMKQPVYYLLKDNDIKKRLKEHGLDIKGSRKLLEQRLKSFIALWNSQCDVDTPMTKLDMIMKLKRDEHNLQKIPSVAPPAILNYDRDTDPSIIESKQQAYVNQHKSHFSMLVQKAKMKKNSTVTAEDEGKSTDVTTDMLELNLTPKRKLSSDSDETATTSSQVNSVKRSRLFAAPKPIYSKSPCPVCNEQVAENLLQSHVERCLDKPEPRVSTSRKGNKSKVSKRKPSEGEESDDEDFDMSMLNATPDIIVVEEDDDDDDIVHSTPIRAEKENRRVTRKKAKAGSSSPIL